MVQLGRVQSCQGVERGAVDYGYGKARFGLVVWGQSEVLRGFVAVKYGLVM